MRPQGTVLSLRKLQGTKEGNKGMNNPHILTAKQEKFILPKYILYPLTNTQANVGVFLFLQEVLILLIIIVSWVNVNNNNIFCYSVLFF